MKNSFIFNFYNLILCMKNIFMNKICKTSKYLNFIMKKISNKNL